LINQVINHRMATNDSRLTPATADVHGPRDPTPLKINDLDKFHDQRWCPVPHGGQLTRFHEPFEKPPACRARRRVLSVKDGRIAHLREYFDPVRAALAFDAPIAGVAATRD